MKNETNQEAAGNNNMQQVGNNNQQNTTIINIGTDFFKKFKVVDWIRYYLDVAENTQDEYMAAIWRKLLAKELDVSNSISKKAVNILKDMTQEEFKMFEKVCSISISFWVVSDETIYQKAGLNWDNMNRLHEYGLININPQTNGAHIKKRQSVNFQCGNNYTITIGNAGDLRDFPVIMPGFTLTSVGRELREVVDYSISREVAEFYAKWIRLINNKIPEMRIVLFENTNGQIDFTKQIFEIK